MSNQKEATDRQGNEYARLARSKRVPRDVLQRAHDDGTIARVLEDIGNGVPIITEASIRPRLDSIVTLNRRRALEWPSQVKSVCYAHLEAHGSNHFDANDPRNLFLQFDQQYGRVEEDLIWSRIFDQLKFLGGLTELLAIKKRGLPFYRRYYSGKKIFGWKGQVEMKGDDTCGGLHVPFLVEWLDELRLEWCRIKDHKFGPDDPALIPTF